jgi:hypothetical protein
MGCSTVDGTTHFGVVRVVLCISHVMMSSATVSPVSATVDYLTGHVLMHNPTPNKPK